MDFNKVSFIVSGEGLSDMLIAILSDAGYDGFEETENELLAYIPVSQFDASFLESISEEYNISYQTSIIPKQNWNQVWESNFEPVIIDDYCTIRASFHDIKVNTKYDIIVTPKMSFGTGHHATTQLMMLLMKNIYFEGLKVVDFGTGTGVLAILAEKLGAKDIIAIDNDEWAVTNAKENVVNNACITINVSQASINEIEFEKVDIILANINRHILIMYMQELANRLSTTGSLLISGLLKDDKEIILASVENVGLKLKEFKEQNNWIAMTLGW